jgi:cell division septal protein FtsQ
VLAGLEPGERIESDAARAGLEVWSSLPRKIQEQVASVVAPSRVRVALALRDGTLVRYGGADRLGAKNKVLSALLARLHAEHRTATYIDVSVPATPAVGPPQATPTATPTPVPAV